ncbi:MAG: hypothetical protein ACKN85_00895, partial [Pirellula sp.]
PPKADQLISIQCRLAEEEPWIGGSGNKVSIESPTKNFVLETRYGTLAGQVGPSVKQPISVRENPFLLVKESYRNELPDSVKIKGVALATVNPFVAFYERNGKGQNSAISIVEIPSGRIINQWATTGFENPKLKFLKNDTELFVQDTARPVVFEIQSGGERFSPSKPDMFRFERIATSNDGQLLATIATYQQSAELSVWKMDEYKLLVKKDISSVQARGSLLFTSDNQLLLNGSDVYRVADLEAVLQTNKSAYYGNNSWIAVEGKGQAGLFRDPKGQQPRIDLWDCMTLKPSGSIPLETAHTVGRVESVSDGRYFVAITSYRDDFHQIGPDREHALLFDGKDGRFLKSIPCPAGRLDGVEVSISKNWIALWCESWQRDSEEKKGLITSGCVYVFSMSSGK